MPKVGPQFGPTLCNFRYAGARWLPLPAGLCKQLLAALAEGGEAKVILMPPGLFCMENHQ